ncbi:hypothetical protein DFP73DRAFT_285602 [Morchella snyderi]|nr:hypothetical protein DFP73DRAFT_285602 [Morchella snyderi]
MTLGSETAAVLMRAMDVLQHQTSAVTHTLLTPEERRSALLQLMVTVETAAKLADVAHVEAVADAKVERIKTESGRLQPEMVMIGKEVESVVMEAERTLVEAETLEMQAEKVMSKAEREMAEGRKVGNEAEEEIEVLERTRAGVEKVGKEVERTYLETERMKAELKKTRSETEQHTATAPPAVAVAPKQLEPLAVPPTPTFPIENSPAPSHPSSMLLPQPVILVSGLYASNTKVKEIADALEEWNSRQMEQYTLAGWAWFMHSKGHAYLLLNRQGTEVILLGIKRDRTGTIRFRGSFIRDLVPSLGYDGLIHGQTRKDGRRDNVKFEVEIETHLGSHKRTRKDK